ncbi:MAG: ABC transporter permease [Candidatus Hodarchaeales archaeon]
MSFKNLGVQIQDNLYNERLKFVILICVMFIQALSSITSIFYMEEILAIAGFEFINPITPSTEAAFIDFFNDQLLLYLLLMALGAMGLFASEIENGSIEFYLTRPITRTNYALSKIVARLSVLVLPFIITSLVIWGYLGLVFEIIPLGRLIFALIPVVLLYLYFGCITSALSTRFSAVTSGFTAIGIFLVQFTLSSIKPIELLSPIAPANIWMKILQGTESVLSVEYFLSVFLLILWVVVPLIAAVYSFTRRDL